ncbi:hypothetical protein [Rickettsia endosymbiont of Gonocerus acuteangulatus]|uniref:hypothetical protein n=1 Tax=Rickettsia endosymbiont of Gonocerus acuteangulatus TaxID=3066266 RepID=UPI003132F499
MLIPPYYAASGGEYTQKRLKLNVFYRVSCHCEERSEEAISESLIRLPCSLQSLA